MSSYKSGQKNEMGQSFVSTENKGADLEAAKSQQAETVKQLAISIKDYSITARETLRAIRDSGVIPELAVSLSEITALIRDISMQAKEASDELKKSGVMGETAGTVRETLASAKEVAHELKEAAKSGPYKPPQETTPA